MYRVDLSLGEALPGEDGHRPPQLASEATDQNPGLKDDGAAQGGPL